MKKELLKGLIAIAVLLIGLNANAHDFYVNGIYYRITDASEKTVEVTYKGDYYDSFHDEYSGDIVIPKAVTYNGIKYSVTGIGICALYWCKKLTSVVMPNTITYINNWAFWGSNSIQSIVIPENVIKLGANAFLDCSGLRSVTIGKSVERIYGGTFEGCSNLKNITISDGDTMLTIEIHYTDDYGKNAAGTFIDCPLETLYLGRDLYICNSWASGYSPFFGQKNLKSVTIGRKVKILPRYIFADCSGLEQIFIPNNVEEIGETAFKSCTKLKYLHIEDGNTILKLGANTPSPYSPYHEGLFAPCSLENLYIGRDLDYELWTTEEWGYSPFYNQYQLKSVKFGNTVTILPKNLLRSCTAITEIAIPNSVENICDYAFYDSDLTQLYIPNSVTNIGRYAFYNNNNLLSVTFGTGLKKIGDSAFDKTSIKKAIWLTGTPPNNYTGVKSPLNYVSNELYTQFPNATVYQYLNSIFNVDGIRYVPVSPSNRTCDAIDCAYDSTSINVRLNNVVSFKGIEMNVNCLKPYLLYGNKYVETCEFNVCHIPGYSLSGCSSLSEVTINENVATLSDSLFVDCTSLSNITIANRETELSLGSNGSKPLFADCPLKTVYIGGNISYPTSSSYGYSPFYRNTTLETVTITNKETEISENEFYGCSSLKNITMGDGVESIGNWAFSGCSSLEYFSFGSGMKTIGKEAFSDCTAMTKLISKAAVPPTCDTQALDDINKWNCELHVPEASINTYKSADQWKEFFFIDGVEQIAANVIDDVDVNVENGCIVVRGANNDIVMVEVYTAGGQLIYRGNDTTISVSEPGIYIVKVAGTAVKVAVA